MSSKRIKRKTKPDTRYNPAGTEQYIERQRKREEAGFVVVRENGNTIRVIMKIEKLKKEIKEL